MNRALVIILAALPLAGCGSEALNSFTIFEAKEKPIVRDLMPANFKQEIASTVPSVVVDPRGIRDAYYSDPVMDPKVNTYASCVRFNAPDGSGGSLGVKEYAAYYYGGHLNQLAPAPPEACRGVSYKPFPELEKLCPNGRCNTN